VQARQHNGSMDIGFGPEGVVPDDAIEVHMIRVDPLWIALRKDDPLASGESVNWQDLRERLLINYMPNLAINVLSHVPVRHHPKHILPVHRVNTALSLLQVRQGCVICPSMARSLVQGFGLAFRPLRQPTVTWRIAIFARNRASLSPAVESFLDYTLQVATTWDTASPPFCATAAAELASWLAVMAASAVCLTVPVSSAIEEAAFCRLLAVCSVRWLRSRLPVAISALAVPMLSAALRMSPMIFCSDRCVPSKAVSSRPTSSEPPLGIGCVRSKRARASAASVAACSLEPLPPPLVTMANNPASQDTTRLPTSQFLAVPALSPSP
ncbi:MAG: hypothetical protein EOP40_04910, partial [Rubrivivax sp.]